MAILHLTLHRKWFDLIASGKKNIEYRQDTLYWHKRIFNKDGKPKQFNEIHFRNGYDQSRPLMVTQFAGALVTHADLCHPYNGEELTGRIVLIGIGHLIRFENYLLRYR